METQNASVMQAAQNKLRSEPGNGAIIPHISFRVNQLNDQHMAIFNGVLGDLNSISERLRAIGYRLNPEEHPDETPKNHDGSSKPGPAPLQPISDVNGLKPKLDVIIEANDRLLSLLQKEVFPQLNGYINHIESNI